MQCAALKEKQKEQREKQLLQEKHDKLLVKHSKLQEQFTQLQEQHGTQLQQHDTLLQQHREVCDSSAAKDVQLVSWGAPAVECAKGEGGLLGTGVGPCVEGYSH